MARKTKSKTTSAPAKETVQLTAETEGDDAAPEVEPIDSEDDDDVDEASESQSQSEEEYDSAAEDDEGDDANHPDEESSDFDPEVSDEDEFEDQGSSDDDEDRLERQMKDDDDDDESDVEILEELDVVRSWPKELAGKKRAGGPNSTAVNPADRDEKGAAASSSASDAVTAADADTTAKWMHADDLSSDDEDADGAGNRIGRVPLHWYDDYDHIGYDAHGQRVVKSQSSSASKDILDRVIDAADDLEANAAGNGKFTVYDALNARDVALTPRQVELIRRLQSGAFAHPEHDANPDYVAYFSGVDPEVSGLNSDRYEKKSRFQPSKWEKLQVRRLLHRLKCGSINMDYLEGRVRDMNDLVSKSKDEDPSGDKPFLLWKGDEEDELALRKGPQHMPAPKLPPPGHAYSYNPPEEYLPNEQELKEWEELDPEDRPYGHFVPKKHPNLRSVGAYEHAVRERFERCLDLYLCPRAMKRRLNIDPESLVPSLPKASDLRPFPTAKVVAYEVPETNATKKEDAAVMVRCLTVSPDGQFLVSGDENGVVRLWEVQTGRLLRSWDLMLVLSVGEENDDQNDKSQQGEPQTKKPVSSLEWNPNRSHHCLLATIGKCAIVISTGTGGPDDSELTDALLSAASACKHGGNIAPESRAAKAVKWTSLQHKKSSKSSSNVNANTPPISAYGTASGPICLLRTNRECTHVQWHRKGDYFVTVSPKAGAAAVLIHQLSKAASQQPFGKVKGEIQLACFHPQKPFLFVASKEHVRVYHLVKQMMVKRLMSGCRHISSLDVHGSGDHVVVGSLDRRLVWFDLDLANTPYKTLKYHERALRSVGFHPRYPLMASASDDGSIHVFHSMIYSDLMRNPLIVPVKVLRGHNVVNSLGTLAMVFHPTQPWLFSAGADGKIHLFQDL